MVTKTNRKMETDIAMQSINEAREPEPICGYTRMYLHEYDTPWGEHRREILHGDIRREISDLPSHMEYDNVAHKYLGVSMITMVPVLNSKNQPIFNHDTYRIR